MFERKMTKGTHEFLIKRKSELSARIKILNSDFSGHQRAMLHDDSGTYREIINAQNEINEIGDLRKIVYIIPRENISDVGIGNEVTLKYDNEDEEKFIFLSKDDVSYRQDLGPLISEDSPLGSLIRGKSAGEEVDLAIRNMNVRVKIVSIDKGIFE